MQAATRRGCGFFSRYGAMSALHPVSRLLLWLGFLIGVQGLDGRALLTAFLLPLLCGRGALQRGVKLVWRTRWLLLSLLVVFTWGVAGEPLWPSDYAPTQEGVQVALTQLARLLLVLLAVAALLETMSLPELLSASHVLLWPLRRLGVDTDRGIVRLMLVLRYVETLPSPRAWRILLDVPEATPDESFELPQIPFGLADLLVPGFILLLLIFFHST